MKNPAVLAALEEIRTSNDGLLLPQTVVEHARNPESPLHDCFEWDDSEAAEQFRLWQARSLIRVCVTVEPQTQQTIRTYVSVMPQRKESGGGYLSTIEAMSDPVQRALVLETALRELTAFEKKYQQLQELAPVFAAMDQVRSGRRSGRRKRSKQNR